MALKIYHNPRCMKSRQTLQIINEKGAEVEVVEHLKEVPDTQEIKSLLEKLDMSAEEIIRKGEDAYKQHFKGKTMDEEGWIKAMIEYPKLIERPIVVKGDRAVIGRPPENVTKLL